jgi:hypothetical protein
MQKEVTGATGNQPVDRKEELRASLLFRKKRRQPQAARL